MPRENRIVDNRTASCLSRHARVLVVNINLHRNKLRPCTAIRVLFNSHYVFRSLFIRLRNNAFPYGALSASFSTIFSIHRIVPTIVSRSRNHVKTLARESTGVETRSYEIRILLLYLSLLCFFLFLSAGQEREGGEALNHGGSSTFIGTYVGP